MDRAASLHGPVSSSRAEIGDDSFQLVDLLEVPERNQSLLVAVQRGHHRRSDFLFGTDAVPDADFVELGVKFLVVVPHRVGIAAAKKVQTGPLGVFVILVLMIKSMENAILSVDILGLENLLELNVSVRILMT